jgi:hypothetical protein
MNDEQSEWIGNSVYGHAELSEKEFRRLYLNDWPKGQVREMSRRDIGIRMYAYPTDVRKWLDAIDRDLFARTPGADSMRENHPDDARYIELADKWPTCETQIDCWYVAYEVFVKESLEKSLESARKAIQDVYGRVGLTNFVDEYNDYDDGY